MAANIDAVETAASFGIDKDHSANYYQDSYGTDLSYGSMNKFVTNLRCGLNFTTDWKKDVEEHYKKKK